MKGGLRQSTFFGFEVALSLKLFNVRPRLLHVFITNRKLHMCFDWY